MVAVNAHFAVGQLVRHTLFGYRGVIIDVDLTCQDSQEWYEKLPEKPSKEEPWYHILVHGSVHRAYVAESQLEQDFSAEPLEHPELDYFFEDFQNGTYIPHHITN
jgi:heat shock protein HspQ